MRVDLPLWRYLYRVVIEVLLNSETSWVASNVRLVSNRPSFCRCSIAIMNDCFKWNERAEGRKETAMAQFDVILFDVCGVLLTNGWEQHGERPQWSTSNWTRHGCEWKVRGRIFNS